MCLFIYLMVIYLFIQLASIYLASVIYQVLLRVFGTTPNKSVKNLCPHGAYSLLYLLTAIIRCSNTCEIHGDCSMSTCVRLVQWRQRLTEGKLHNV